jgi:hypothetical protein
LLARILAAAVLLTGLLASQEIPQGSAPPTFRAETNLVTVRFQVRLGSGSASDLKPSDVVLLEDGVPRAFTLFEAPTVRLTLDLVVMFDVTSPLSDQTPSRVGFWNPQALQDLANYWREGIARPLLEERGATVRFSIYRFDQTKLQRLGKSISDPKMLRDALSRLMGPASQDVSIPLPAKLAIRASELRRSPKADLPTRGR